MDFIIIFIINLCHKESIRIIVLCEFNIKIFTAELKKGKYVIFILPYNKFISWNDKGFIINNKNILMKKKFHKSKID